MPHQHCCDETTHVPLILWKVDLWAFGKHGRYVVQLDQNDIGLMNYSYLPEFIIPECSFKKNEDHALSVGIKYSFGELARRHTH